jgi:hypothetical protein
VEHEIDGFEPIFGDFPSGSPEIVVWGHSTEETHSDTGGHKSSSVSPGYRQETLANPGEPRRQEQLEHPPVRLGSVLQAPSPTTFRPSLVPPRWCGPGRRWVVTRVHRATAERRSSSANKRTAFDVEASPASFVSYTPCARCPAANPLATWDPDAFQPFRPDKSCVAKGLTDGVEPSRWDVAQR